MGLVNEPDPPGGYKLEAWLRREIETDRELADLISSGGFVPPRWDTEPAGQVNPPELPHSVRNAIDAALIPDEEDRMLREVLPHWVQVVAYERMTGEPPEADARDSDLPVMLVDDGRRAASHVIRHDPRWVVADCDAKLAVLDEHHILTADNRSDTWAEWSIVPRRNASKDHGCVTCHYEGMGGVRGAGVCRTVRLLASGYRHRPGYREEWKP